MRASDLPSAACWEVRSSAIALSGGGNLRVRELHSAGQGDGHMHLLRRTAGRVAAVAKTEYRGQDAHRGERVKTASRQSIAIKIEKGGTGVER